RIEPLPGSTRRPPDAWDLVERIGYDLGDGVRLSLDHVVVAAPYTDPHPYTGPPPYTDPPPHTHPPPSPHPPPPTAPPPYPATHPYPDPRPYTDPHPAPGLAEYGRPGLGGRSPVSWVGPRPRRRFKDGRGPGVTAEGFARPVVAVLDSGTGPHPWLPDTVVVRDPEVDGVPVGTFPVPANPEADGARGGMSIAPLTGPLGPVAGHGTFISGIVFQQCPDALVLACRLYGGPGIIAEWDLLRSLRRLLVFHLAGVRGEKGCYPVDVLVLSCG